MTHHYSTSTWAHPPRKRAKYIDGLVYAFLGGAGAFAGIAAALTLHGIGG